VEAPTSSASGELRFSDMNSHARLSAASASAALADSQSPGTKHSSTSQFILSTFRRGTLSGFSSLGHYSQQNGHTAAYWVKTA